MDNLNDRRYRLMEGFEIQTPLRLSAEVVEAIKKKWMFALLDTNGVMSFKPGFCNNGTDWSKDTYLNTLAGLVHDFGCELREEGLLTKEQIRQVDDLFEEYLEKAVYESDKSEAYKTLAKARFAYMVAAVRLNTKIQFGA